MKKIALRTTALALAAVLAASHAALASQALGTELQFSSTALAQGVDYVRQYLWSATYSDLRTERYLEYTPNQVVTPAVSYGSTVLTRSTLTDMAEQLESQGKRVLGGINGDYFVMATGAPLGMVITDGVLRSSSSYHYALGFNADGTAFIGQPNLSITASFRGSTLAVSGGLNKVRTNTGGYVLYTSDYGADTNHTSAGVDVILTPSTDQLGQSVSVDLDVEEVPEDTGTQSEQTQPEGEQTPLEESAQEQTPGDETITDSEDLAEEDTAITDSEDLTEEDVTQGEQEVDQVTDTLVYTDVPMIGGRISCTVDQVLQSSGSIEIPEGKLVLSINNQSNEWLVSELAALQPGDTVDIDITCTDTRWEGAVTAMGALYKMVTNGVVESGLETTQSPRSAVGVRADGSTVFYTVDGRQSGVSVGASMEQVAERLVELGCVEAVCMDGGGSTTIGATLPGESAFQLENSPSDGSQRAVSNALFLVADQAAPGEAVSLMVDPGDAIVLPNTALDLTVGGLDQIGQSTQFFGDVQYEIASEGGSVEDNMFTAGETAGSYVLTASADGLTGQAVYTVVPTPDQITVQNEATGAALTSINLEPGGQIDLTASATWCNLAVTAQDTSFTWAVTGELGTIDENGLFTAGETGGTGTITVTAGEKTVSIPLSVAGHVLTLEDFEGEFEDMAGSDTAQIEPETRQAYVRYGARSARVTYNATDAEYAAVAVNMPIAEGEQYLNLWVYGDASGNTLAVPVRGEDGTVNDAIVAVLNFTGWQQVTLPMPAGMSELLMLKILPTGSTPMGIIWVDQITTSNQYLSDTTPPTVQVSLSDSTLTAVVGDDVDKSYVPEQITVTYDGWQLAFTVNETSITAALPAADGKAHRVTVTVTDASGNIGQGSADIAASGEQSQPFSDIENHWAENYVNYLYDQGISNGVVVGDTVQFQPDKDITRGEFALMVARWMRLDLAEYSSVELPFADVDAIPSWALDGVKAMYQLGIMQGSAEADGTYAFAERTINRAEAMTMLGRIQLKGYASAQLDFTDAADVPTWAAEYVSTLVAQGVINGYSDGTIAPLASIKRGEIAKILYTMR